MPLSSYEQTAGLSTAESDSIGGSRHSAAGSSSMDGQSGEKTQSGIAHKSDVPHLPSPKKGSQFSRSRRHKWAKSQDGMSLAQSISNSAPTILVRTPLPSPNCDPLDRSIRSIMTNRSLHESLHRGQRCSPRRPGMGGRSVSFANVNIREYQRVLGDNPSVTSGPPLSIGWGHTVEPIVMDVEEYEKGKGFPRSSSEYLVPKSVREGMLKEHAGVSRREMVNAVRVIQKEKAQRRKTVVNLSMQKTEERLEGAKRKIKKILKPSSSYDRMEAKLWDDAHAVAMEKAKRLEESIRNGESVSMKNVYSVGTPYDNVLPSRRNSTRVLDAEREVKRDETVEIDPSIAGEHDPSVELMAKHYAYAPIAKSTQIQKLPEREHNESHAYKTTSAIAGKEQSGQSTHHTSGTIVASECESDEIFAKLVLDDALNQEE